jgi:hypothetical protein
MKVKFTIEVMVKGTRCLYHLLSDKPHLHVDMFHAFDLSSTATIQRSLTIGITFNPTTITIDLRLDKNKAIFLYPTIKPLTGE